MNIIDTLKAEAFHALNTCEACIKRNDRDWAVCQFGRATGLLQALDKLIGEYAPTENLKQMKNRLMDELWKP